MDISSRIRQLLLLLICFLTLVLCADIDIRRMFHCQSCQSQACPGLRYGCELVREPGLCSCCLVCARTEGETCGLNKGRCGRGMTCVPFSDEPEQMIAMIFGRASCQPDESNTSSEQDIRPNQLSDSY